MEKKLPARSPRRQYAPNRIREVRRARGLSMEQLGAALRHPVKKAAIQKLEDRSMGLTLDYMLEIAEALGCSPAELIAPDGAMEAAGPEPVGAQPAGEPSAPLDAIERKLDEILGRLLT